MTIIHGEIEKFGDINYVILLFLSILLVVFSAYLFQNVYYSVRKNSYPKMNDDYASRYIFSYYIYNEKTEKTVVIKYMFSAILFLFSMIALSASFFIKNRLDFSILVAFIGIATSIPIIYKSISHIAKSKK